MRIFKPEVTKILRATAIASTVLAVFSFSFFLLRSSASVETQKPTKVVEQKDWPAHPKPGISLPIEIIEVYDGDTVTVKAELKISVRLLDRWAPEVVGVEKPEGLISRDKLREIGHGKRGVLHIPMTDNIGTSLTFNRVLGYVWLTGDPKSLNQRMVEDGFATTEKQK